MTTKLARVVTYLDGLLPCLDGLLPFTFDHVVLKDHVTNQNHYIFTNTVLMVTKLDTMVTHLDGLLTVKSHDPLIP